MVIATQSRKVTMFGIFKSFGKSKTGKVHLLHIGKTGGTAIKSVLKKNLDTTSFTLELHGHGVNLKQIPDGEKVVFFLRHPVSRFISGFYSRQRKGMPRHHSEWNPVEAEAFATFKTPNELAWALSDVTSESHGLALRAMKKMRHLSHFKRWYVDMAYFKTRSRDILFVGFQESLSQDFETLKSILKLPSSLVLPEDDVAAHKSSGDLDKKIDEIPMKCLEKWYREDLEFIALCKKLMAEKSSAR
jgi:hypothetical protein